MSTSDSMGMNPTNNASDTIEEAKEEISQVSSEGADAARDVAESRFEQGREATTEKLESASEAMDEVALKLEENDSPFASYAAELSDQLSSFSNRLSTSSIDDLVGGARTLARENPAAFMLGSMAIGLAASRFFKATGEQVYRQSDDSGETSGTYHYDHGSNRQQGYHSSGTSYPDNPQASHGSSTIAGANDNARSSSHPSASTSSGTSSGTSSSPSASATSSPSLSPSTRPSASDSRAQRFNTDHDSRNEDAAEISKHTAREETQNEY